MESSDSPMWWDFCMQTIIILIFGALILIVAFPLAHLLLQGKHSISEEKLPYRLRPSIFNKSEEALFIELKKSIPSTYYIFTKVRLIDFIEPKNLEYKWRNKIWSRHVDFLICDQFYKPVLAIELNGKSHLDTKRVEVDKFKVNLFKNINLPQRTINVGSDFVSMVNEIKSIIVVQN